MTKQHRGLTVPRHYTRPGADPLSGFSWTRRNSKITNPDGSTVFEMADAEVPAQWSQVATDIIVSKYFRKAGVPQLNSDGSPRLDGQGAPVLGAEASARQVFHRLSATWRAWGEKYSYFATADDAQAFEDELKYMLAAQIASPNSPQWFNTGLHHAYGLTGPAQGFWYVDADTGEVQPSPDSYSRPAPHACFIQSVNDDLVNAGGIMDLWLREARLFKFGAGTGTNFSNLRGENESLSGGGKSSGLMSFLKIGDRAAGAIKSGGTTRRAAKMVILDIDHPDIEQFIAWKADEEKKVRALIAAGYPSDFNGTAYQTVSGQNSNNSVRLSDDFLQAVATDRDWELVRRTDGKIAKTVPARRLWDQIAAAAWACADPGVQFETTINAWHTCPAGGRIKATNPCSEYVFLDDTACNLASLNLVAFFDDESGDFDVDAYLHAIRLWTIVLDISVSMAQFPSREIAVGSHDYRTLGLGYANLGSLLMRSGIPYDSEAGQAIIGALTAILSGHAYATSAELAAVVGPFPRFADNREAMLRVIRNHRRAAHNQPQSEYEQLNHEVTGIDPAVAPGDLLHAARMTWDNALALGETNGFRNAQVSVLAPTGTIALQMDCDTTGVEPDFALIKFKKLAGGGYFKIVNQSVAPALRRLGYPQDQIETIVTWVIGTMTLEGAPYVNRLSLTGRGFTADEIGRIEATLPGVFDLRHAFNVFVVGTQALARLGFSEEQYTALEFDLLTALHFTDEQVRAAADVICGRQTIEGAPGLKDEHLAVFDCANRNGRYGQRFIHHRGHLRAMAAAQPFISGAISKTVNLPNQATVAEIEESYQLAWKMGLKALSVYRDGSKASQPLSVLADEGERAEEQVELDAALEPEASAAMGRWPAGASPSQAYAGVARPRFLLPARRRGFTQEARVGGHKIFLRTGEYSDGTLGEVFVDLAKEGATLRGILSCFAIAVSKGLQYGVPLEEFVDTFTFHTFEPRGMVEGHPNIKMANSIVDYVFRALGLEYLGRTDLVQVPPAVSLPEPPSTSVVDAGLQLDLTEAAMESDIDAQAVAARFVDAAIPAVAQAPRLVRAAAAAAKPATAVGAAANGVDSALADLMGDAPLCDTCGHITVRNGSCYRCLNCGNSMGCS